MIKLIRTAIVVGAIAAAGAASAQQASPTLEEKLASGQLSYAAFVQLISGSGYTEDEARQLTLHDIGRAKSQWTDN